MESNVFVSHQSVCTANVFLVIAEFGRKKTGQNQEHSWAFMKSSARDMQNTCLYETRFKIQTFSLNWICLPVEYHCS